jgi:hypothetical protein
MEMIVEGSARSGRPWTNIPKYKEWFEELGLEEVREETYYIPLGPWAKSDKSKRPARLTREDLVNGVEGMTMRIAMTVFGWDAGRVLGFVERVKRDLLDPRVHAYLPW